MIVEINVTQEHIDKGVKGDCDNCPIWHAIRPLISDNYDFSIYGDTCNIYDKECRDDKHVAERWLPMLATQFISDFDDDGKPNLGLEPVEIKPFTFELDIPEIYLRTGTVG